MVSHNSLGLYYKNMFALVQIHKYNLDTIENMIPYERDLYIEMLADLIKESKQKA
jgi:hypothetical protein